MAISLPSKQAVLDWLSNLLNGRPEEDPTTSSSCRPFIPSKPLVEKDHIIIDMLNSASHENVCFCVCDTDMDDMPIIFASDGFCSFTGYKRDEIEGRNCRFLQGPRTSKEDVDRIRLAIMNETEANVNLLNYRKDGSEFVNQFFLGPLHSRDDDKKVVYYIGVQCQVDRLGPGQMPANPGWIYTQGNHV